MCSLRKEGFEKKIIYWGNTFGNAANRFCSTNSAVASRSDEQIAYSYVDFGF